MSAVLTIAAPLPGQVRGPRPLLCTPYYARAAVSATAEPQVHEYRGRDFMTRFDADLAAHRLPASRNQPWFAANRLDGSAYPSLRLPIHDGSYLVAAELCCDDRARAPLDPRRVVAAWAVLGPRGSATAAGSGVLAGRASLAAAVPPPGAVPLRARVVTDAGGRPHTLLAGLLPVSDQPPPVDAAATARAIDTAAGQLAGRVDPTAAAGTPPGTADLVLWRPAAANGLDPRLGAALQLLDEHLGLGVVGGQLADTARTIAATANATGSDAVTLADWRGWLGEAFFYAEPDTGPNTLLYQRQGDYGSERNRAHANIRDDLLPIGTPQSVRDAVTALAAALAATPVPARTARELGFASRADYTLARIRSLTAGWLGYVATLAPLARTAAERLAPFPVPVRDAVNRLRTVLEGLRLAAEGLNAQFADPLRYRRQSLHDWLVRDRRDEDKALAEQLPSDRKLICPGAWPRTGADLTRRRVRQLAAGLGNEIAAVATAGSQLAEAGALYEVTVHARIRGEHGCEYLVHSAAAGPFRIASFYETRLMPPRPIRMPGLADLKKAVAGAAMILPDDLAAEVSKLRFPDGEVEASGPSLSGRWVYVFSIPIVTICAMIILMLMINILNFIFRWLPYAILRIPLPR